MEIGGEAEWDLSGYSISLSADGNIVAIGGYANDGNGSTAGHVRVYAWEGSSWIQRGLDIDGTAGDYSGWSLSLSDDGNIVAIGAPVDDSATGNVRVYVWDGSSWIQRGLDIDGEAEDDLSGFSVSLSADGNIVAIGAIGGPWLADPAGYVRVYAWDGSSWIQRGLDIDGAAGDYSGSSISLSNDGNIVAIGAHWNDGGFNDAGCVRIYEWDGSSWIQRGLDITGELSHERLGYRVSLSGDGSIVAIGNQTQYNENGSIAGLVKVYTWDGSSWGQKGLDIDGEVSVDSQKSMCLSADGSSVAIGTPGYDAEPARVYEFSCVVVEGCTNFIAENFDPSANVDDGSCIIPGCIFEVACNYNPEATTDDGSCIFICPGCTDPVACNYDNGALQEDGSCLYPVDIYGASNVNCLGECLSDEDGDGVCLEDEVYGCTNSEACNYNNLSTEEDGSCEFLSCAGCTDEGACNFDPEVTIEDNLGCEYETCAGCTYEFACNYDPEATISDNDSCEFGSCPGCTDPEALNYNPTVTEDDGSCEYPLGFNTCGDPVSYQGYDYSTVLIGDQCWFAENLRSENYENGDAIPSNLSDSYWEDTTSGAVAVYGEGSSTCYNHSPEGDACDEAWALNEYGRLYNWYAVDDARGLCPSGWHVPTDGEWTVLTDHLGGAFEAGGQMKTTYGWYNGVNGTNSSGFSGLPGGLHSGSNGYFGNAGLNGYWWSSSPLGSSAWHRSLSHFDDYVLVNYSNPQNGLSVRCIKDSN